MKRIKSSKLAVRIFWWMQLVAVALMLLHVWQRQTMFFENYGFELPVSPVIEFNVAVFYFPVLGVLQSIRQYLVLNAMDAKPGILTYGMIRKGILWIKMILWLGFAGYMATDVYVYNSEVFPPVNAMDVFFLILPVSLVEGISILLKYIHDRKHKSQFYTYFHQKTNWLDVSWLVAITVVRTGLLFYLVIHWVHLNAIGQWETVWDHFGEILTCLYPLSVIYVADLLMQRRWTQRIWICLQMPEFGEVEI